MSFTCENCLPAPRSQGSLYLLPLNFTNPHEIKTIHFNIFNDTTVFAKTAKDPWPHNTMLCQRLNKSYKVSDLTKKNMLTLRFLWIRIKWFRWTQNLSFVKVHRREGVIFFCQLQVHQTRNSTEKESQEVITHKH